MISRGRSLALYAAAAVVLPTLAAAQNASPYRTSEPSPTQQVIDANFQGSVTYSGSYSGSVRGPAPSRSSAPQAHFNIGGINLNVPTDTFTGRPPLKRIQGAITFTLTFDRGRVRGTYATNGDVHPGSVQGTVERGYCTLYDDAGGAPWSGPCDAQGFEGSNPSTSPGTLTFRTTTSSIIDLATRNRQLAEQRRVQEEQQREQQRLLKAKLAHLTPLERKIEAVLEEDASSWIRNRYDIGSVNNAHAYPQSKKNGSAYWTAKYTYNGGSVGGVHVKLIGGQISCVEFFDQQGECRPVGSRLGTVIAKGASLMGNSSSSREDEGMSPSQRANYDQDREMQVERQVEQRVENERQPN